MASNGSGKGAAASPADFDPLTQPFTLLLPDGSTPFKTSLLAVNVMMSTAVHAAIIQSLQIGMASSVLLVLLIMTKKEKRRSIVFVVNSIALLFVMLRGIFDLVTMTGPYYVFYRWITNWYVNLGDAPTASAVGEIFNFGLTWVIEFALVLQVRIVCCTLTSLKRNLVNGINIFVATVACGFHFTLGILNIQWSILNTSETTMHEFIIIGKLMEMTYIAITTSIGLASLIFVTKLAFAIKQRRSLGMTQFGPMQIIFIMGCQTMFIPFVFTIVGYFAVRNVQMQTFVQTSVAILLPLSGMWAANNSNTGNIPKLNLRGNFAVPASADGTREKIIASRPSHLNNTSTTLVSHANNKTAANKSTSSDGPADLEMQKIDGVLMNRSYSVRSDYQGSRLLGVGRDHAANETPGPSWESKSGLL